MSTDTPTPPSLRTRIIRVARWAFINGLLGTTAWYAVYQGSKGATNCIIAFCWFQLVMCFLVLLLLIMRNHMPTDPLADIKSKGRSVPAWLSHLVGLAGIIMFLWNGWWFCGVVQIVNEIIEALMYSDDQHRYTPPAGRRERAHRPLTQADVDALVERQRIREEELRREQGPIERRDRPRRERTPQPRSQPSEEPPALESRNTRPRIELE